MTTEKVNSGSSSFVFKALVAGVVIFAGIGGGIYVGLASSGKSAISGLKPGMMQNTTNLNIGDVFPDYALVDMSSGEGINVSELTKSGPLLLAFMSTTCGPCKSMATYWRKRGIAMGLRDDIQMAVIYDRDDFLDENLTDPVLDIPNSTSFSAIRSAQRDEDGILSTPSLVGIGRDGKVLFITSGFSRDLNADFINDYM